MGLFSRKNKAQPVNNSNIPTNTHRSSNTDFVPKQQPELGLKFEFHNNDVDTTHLIVKNRDMNFPDKHVYNCLVSWYKRCINDDYAVMLDPELGITYDMSTSPHSESILAELDINLLQSDPVYQRAVMKSLLNEERVNKYLNVGMMTYDEIANAQADGNDIALCGRYIGGITKNDKGYTKFFNPLVGRIAHNLPDMVQERRKAREDKENARNAEIARRKSEIARDENKIAKYKDRINENKARLNELESDNER